jgi:hypothetical protein
MKLFEEFNEYENLWSEDEIDKVLHQYDDFEIEYAGFESEWYEDHFDPGSYWGHYQTDGVNDYSDFTYEVDAVSIFETLRDTILPKKGESKADDPVVKEWLRLNELAVETAGTPEEDKALYELELFLAKNLDSFFKTFIKEISEYYKEDAQEWAVENLDPIDYSDYRD